MNELPRKPGKGLLMVGGLVLIAFLVMPLFGKAITIITNYFWFKEIALVPVFKKTILTQLTLGLLFGIASWVFIYANILVAKRLAARDKFTYVDPFFAQFMFLKPFVKYIYVLGSLFIAFIISTWAAGQWESCLKFFNAVPFANPDPLLHKDIGFYVFRLPFVQFLYTSAQAVLVLSLIAAFLVYLMEQNVGTEDNKLRTSSAAKGHLLFLVGCMCAAFCVSYQLKIYGQVNEAGTVVNGAGFAAIHIYLPFLKAMRFMSIALALYVWASMRSPKFMPAIIAAAVILGGNFLGSTATKMLQKFVVAPNEVVKETPYMKWSIASTRAAFELDKIEEKQFTPSENLTVEALRKNDPTVENIRLWDHAPLKTTFGQLQEIRTYYEFLDVDNDRYLVNGQLRQVMLSPRELVASSLPSRIWINEHLSYTHGYGLCLGPVNRISPEGLPEFFIRDIPPASSTAIKVSRPEIYYGEATANYAIVNTAAKEFDYPSGDQNVYSVYQGTGGVRMGGLLKKTLFALRFKELKLLLSTDISKSSRIVYYRQIMERARAALPFLRYDADPYMVVTDEGRLNWIIDGYTVTNRYPYSSDIRGVGNYIRNSVKTVIDAYDGTMSFYVADPADPIIQTYMKIFPVAFKSLQDMPADVRRHIRYPQTLFSIQASVYATYHMTDPLVYYNKEDLWKIPEQATGGGKQMAPYYTIMKLAEVGEKEEFILMIPFSPAKKENMIAWFAARCDEPNYGKLLVFNFPKQNLVYGPRQIESRIDQDATISQQLTLWNQGGSRVIRGSLLVIPIEQSLIYVQPLYLAAEEGGLPELKRVIVAYGNSIAMEENLKLSLSKIFRGDLAATVAQPQATGAEAQKQTAQAPARNYGALASEANTAFEKAQNALSRRDWSAYGQHMREVERLIKELAGKR